ncbi:MAG: hypothetical protein KC619_27680 [Myxococcales bacterium]|nr:hypothetical protein [Myxococcales bacterium]
MRTVVLIALVLGVLVPSAAGAQDEEGRRYEEGMARGFAYGGWLVSPIYAMPMERAGGSRESLGPGAGAGLHVRLGYELPEGFLVELYGGFAFNEIAAVPMESPTRSHALTQGELGVGLRYNLYTGTPIVPFAQLGGGTRFFFFSWGSDDHRAEVFAVALTGALGMQIALAPFFGVELGALVDYTFGMDAFEAGFVSVSPFAGVTLYLFDESDALSAP